jgi:hypothetical protein
MAEGRGFSRAASAHPDILMRSGGSQSHRGASTRDMFGELHKLPARAFIITNLRLCKRSSDRLIV